MPDLQSELSKLLTQKHFDDGGDIPATAVSEDPLAGPTKRMWQAIKANPGRTARQLADLVGMSQKDAANCVYQLHLKSLTTRKSSPDGYVVFAVGDEYPVFDRGAHMKKLIAKGALRKPKAKKEAVKSKVDVSQPPKFDADAILANLNVLQARELMDKLRKLFGV